MIDDDTNERMAQLLTQRLVEDGMTSYMSVKGRVVLFTAKGLNALIDAVERKGVAVMLIDADGHPEAQDMTALTQAKAKA